MTDQRTAEEPRDPPVVDVRDWPPRQHSDEVREELDREVGTLGVAGPDATVSDPAPGSDPTSTSDPTPAPSETD